MRVYREIGFDGMMMPDHVPQIDGRHRSGAGLRVRVRLHQGADRGGVSGELRATRHRSSSPRREQRTRRILLKIKEGVVFFEPFVVKGSFRRVPCLRRIDQPITRSGRSSGTRGSCPASGRWSSRAGELDEVRAARRRHHGRALAEVRLVEVIGRARGHLCGVRAGDVDERDRQAVR